MFALGCGSDDPSTGGGFPIGAAAMGGASGAGGIGGQGGLGGATGGIGGMAGLGGAGGIGGVAGMINSGGIGGMASGGTGGIAGGMSGGMGASGGSGGMGGGGTGGTGGGVVPSGDLCMRWNDAHANASEGAWDGNTASCEAGSMTEDALATAHELHSLYRTMAGLEPVEMTDAGNQLAQECALLMAANGTISHSPSSSWDCYTAEAADTAGTSSLSTGGAVSSVDGYMVDPGNPTTLGHRRWILSNMLASIGFGSANGFSCQYQPAEWRPSGGKPWAAWPPPGQIPIQAFGAFFAKLDQTGWSIQSDSIDVNSADVTVTSDGADLAVNVTSLLPGYGSQYAISIIPSGWTAAAGKTYHVAVSGTDIEYDVEVVDCE